MQICKGRMADVVCRNGIVCISIVNLCRIKLNTIRLNRNNAWAYIKFICIYFASARSIG